MGQAKGLVTCIQGLDKVDTRWIGYAIFLVEHRRPEVEEKASEDMDLDLKWADRWGQKGGGVRKLNEEIL